MPRDTKVVTQPDFRRELVGAPASRHEDRCKLDDCFAAPLAGARQLLRRQPDRLFRACRRSGAQSDSPASKRPEVSCFEPPDLCIRYLELPSARVCFATNPIAAERLQKIALGANLQASAAIGGLAAVGWPGCHGGRIGAIARLRTPAPRWQAAERATTFAGARDCCSLTTSAAGARDRLVAGLPLERLSPRTC